MNNRILRLLAYRKTLAALAATVTALACWGLSRVVFDDEPRTIFERDDEEFAFLRQLHADFGADDNDVILVIQGEDLFTPRAQAGLREIIRRTVAVDGVAWVTSIFDVKRLGSAIVPLIPPPDAAAERLAQARERALDHPLVAGQLLAPDGKTMLASARLRGDALSVEQMSRVLDRLRSEVQTVAGEHGLTVWLAGHPPVRVDNLVGLRRELLKSIVLSMLVSAAIALMLFRRPVAVAMTVIGPGLGVLWTAGLMGLAGERINTLNSVIPTILFAIGFTDAVHMMIEYRHWRENENSAIVAAANVVEKIGVPCLFTALTTAVGFGSLLFAHTPSVQQFGLWSGIGTLISFVAGILVFPLLGSLSMANRALVSLRQMADMKGHWLRGFVAPVMHWPRVGVCFGILACLAMARSPFQLIPDIRWTEAIPPDSETSLAMERCDRAFGGALLAYVIVEWPEELDIDRSEVLEVVKNAQQCLHDDAEFRGQLSVLNLLVSLPGKRADLSDRAQQLSRVPAQVTERLVRRDLHRLVVTTHVPDIGAAALLPKFLSLEAQLVELEQAHPGFHLRLTGTVVVAARNVNSIVTDLGNCLGIEAICVFLLMTIGLRSVFLGILSMIPNLVPLLVATSILVWTGQPLTLTAAMAFNLCLGLAVDDTIHFLVRFKRELALDDDARSAVLRTIDHIGTAVIMTTLILIGGFATLRLNAMPAIRMFASLSCATLLAALCADLFLLPAMLLCFFGSSPRRQTTSASRSLDPGPSTAPCSSPPLSSSAGDASSSPT